MRDIDHNLTAIDLFAGAGGLSLGFEAAGFGVVLAVDNDKYSAETYRANREGSDAGVVVAEIGELDFVDLATQAGIGKGQLDILLCGPPCQGFSISNMRTRSMDNPSNHLFREFLRCVRGLLPKWVVFENVSGILTLDRGSTVQALVSELGNLGYVSTWAVLNAAGYGIPQVRRRFLLVANNTASEYTFPEPTNTPLLEPPRTVEDAISDLPAVSNGNRRDALPYGRHGTQLTQYQRLMRRGWRRRYSLGNLVTRNNDLVIERYHCIPPGGNWEDIPANLMDNYTNLRKCHTGIYRRLRWDEPSVVISNFRKNMLIHPDQHRGLSVREAARLQSFPDRYIFCGPLGAQQQQVADAVPPLLAEKLASHIARYIGS